MSVFCVLNASVFDCFFSATTASAGAPDFDQLWLEYEKHLAEMKEYEAQSMDIFPEAGFVLKTFIPADAKRPQQLKAFVNLCTDPSIAPPSTEHTGKDNEDRLRIPLSCGPLRDGTDPGLLSNVFSFCFIGECREERAVCRRGRCAAPWHRVDVQNRHGLPQLRQRLRVGAGHAQAQHQTQRG